MTRPAQHDAKRDLREELLEAIESIDRPATVCANGERSLVLPGLEVDRLGTVSLPLGKAQAEALIKLCRQAPYGKGTETVVDTDVRRVWELDPDQFTLTNPKWDDLIAGIVADAQEELGLAGCKLKYDLTDVQLASLFAMQSQLAKIPESSRAIARWLTACRGELERRSAQPPREPAEYRRSAKLSCDCGLCRELAKFLADPDERQRGFPLRKDLRQHLHRVIDESGCDLTHATRRQGRPYTLVCTKTTASHEKACQIYERDRKNLARLIAIGEKARAW